MDSIPHNPSYLYRKKYSYGVRLRVPRDLASWFNGRAEIKLSLHTTSPKKAAERSRLIVGHLQLMFRDIRERGTLAELTAEEMDGLVKAHVAELLKDNVDYMLRSKPLKDDQEVEHQASFFKSLSIDAHDQMIRRDFEGRFNGSDGSVNACQNVDAMLTGAGLKIAPDSPDYSQLCLRMLKGLSDLYGELGNMVTDGILPSGFTAPNGSSVPQGGTPTPPPSGGNDKQTPVTIGQAAQTYWKERSEGWKPRSKANYQPCLAYLLEHFGEDTPVDQIDYYKMKDYRDKLKNEKGLSVARVNFHIGFARAVFRLEMKTTRQLRVNPAGDLNLKDNRRKQDQRDVFEDEDLRKLFVESKQYGRDRFDT